MGRGEVEGDDRAQGVADDDVEALVGDLLPDVRGEVGEVVQAGRRHRALAVPRQVEGEDLPAEVGEVLLRPPPGVGGGADPVQEQGGAAHGHGCGHGCRHG